MNYHILLSIIDEVNATTMQLPRAGLRASILIMIKQNTLNQDSENWVGDEVVVMGVDYRSAGTKSAFDNEKLKEGFGAPP